MNRNPPFSVRHGGVSIPPQLEIGELDYFTRNLLWSVIYTSMEASKDTVEYSSPHLREPWAGATKLAWIRFFNRPVDEYKNQFNLLSDEIKIIIYNAELNSVFDLIELFMSLNHPSFNKLSHRINTALVQGRSAYRVIDGGLITPVTSEELANVLTRGIVDARASGWNNAEAHLADAARELRAGRWSKSIHQSISAVEGVCRVVAGARDLKSALKILSDRAVIHKALADAFLKLYGWTSDQEGIRHALVLNGDSQTDEAAALFMLGACASFVTFAARRNGS